MRISGIYQIKNTVNDKIYIGSAAYIKDRWSWHRKALEKNKHHNILLQRAWNKYGIEAFEFIVLEVVEDKYKLIEREQFWMDWEKPEYNIFKIAASPVGYRHTEEAKLKLSLASKGRKLSQETKNKMSQAQLNRSNEHKLKHSAAMKKRIMTEEHKNKLLEANKRI